jgi:adenylate kinase
MNIVILGPQGSGKGTQAELLAKNLGLSRFESGQILRAIPDLASYLNSGNLVPFHIVDELAEEFLKSHVNQGVIFDGYPRVIVQYQTLKSIVAKYNTRIDHVINIEISENETIRRLSARRTCAKCGEIYNLLTKPPKASICDICGGELTQRDDDKPEAIQRRLAIYREQTHPVFEMAIQEGIGIEINGEQPIEVIHQEILKKING